MARLTIELDDGLHKKLKLQAVDRETTVKRLVNDAIYNIVQQSAQPAGTSGSGPHCRHVHEGPSECLGDRADGCSESEAAGEEWF